MKAKLIIIFLFLIINSYSCFKKDIKKKNISVLEKEGNNFESNLSEVIDYKSLIIKKKTVDTSMVFLIKNDCVFFSQFSDSECDSLEKLNPTAYEIFSENANNNCLIANEILKSINFTQYWSNRRYVKFNYKNEEFILDTRLNNEFIGECCILFKNDTLPRIVFVKSLNVELINKYYNLKNNR